MQRPIILFLCGLLVISAMSFGVYAYIKAHGYQAFYELLDDPFGWKPELPLPEDEATGDSALSPSTEQSTVSKSKPKRKRDPALYNPDGSLRMPANPDDLNPYNTRIATSHELDFLTDGMRLYYGERRTRSNPYHPDYHKTYSFCSVLMPTDDPCLAYKQVASGNEWSLMSREQALQAIARRYRSGRAQTVYIFQARQKSSFPTGTGRAYAAVLSGGSVRIRQTPAATR